MINKCCIDLYFKTNCCVNVILAIITRRPTGFMNIYCFVFISDLHIDTLRLEMSLNRNMIYHIRKKKLGQLYAQTKCLW